MDTNFVYLSYTIPIYADGNIGKIYFWQISFLNLNCGITFITSEISEEMFDILITFSWYHLILIISSRNINLIYDIDLTTTNYSSHNMTRLRGYSCMCENCLLIVYLICKQVSWSQENKLSILSRLVFQETKDILKGKLIVVANLKFCKIAWLYKYFVMKRLAVSLFAVKWNFETIRPYKITITTIDKPLGSRFYILMLEN